MNLRSIKALFIALAFVLTTGCDCDVECDSNTVYNLYLRVGQVALSNEQSEGVDSATVFVFDDQQKLVEIIGINRAGVEAGGPIPIQYTGTGTPRVVVWGNLDDAQFSPEPAYGAALGDLSLFMPLVDGYHLIPDPLYYGTLKMKASGDQVVTIIPATGRIHITARGLAPTADENYVYTTETAICAYDFECTPLTRRGLYRLPAVRRGSNGDLVNDEILPMFAYPQYIDRVDPVRVSLYRLTGDQMQLVGSTDRDDQSMEIIPQAGRCINVLLDFRSGNGLVVHIRITPWDVVEEWLNW